MDKLKSKMASIKRAKTKLQRLRAAVMKEELKPDQKLEKYLPINYVNSNTSAVKKDIYNKNITVIDELSEEQNILGEAVGKKKLLHRYLNDSIQNNTTNSLNSRIPTRTRGDGCEDNESELPERTRGDGEDIINYNTESVGIHDMNTAFIVNKTFTVDESYNRNNKLNECILYDSDVTYSEDDESAFEDDSDCYDSVCELERNVIESYTEDTYIKLNNLKRILSNDDLNARITDDDLLDSFMNTFVHDEESDEGRGSVTSDFE